MPLVAEMRRLFDLWRANAAPGAPALDGMCAALATRLDIDCRRYSDVFEPSFSFDEGGPHFARYSYAFPGYAREPGEVDRVVAGLFAPLFPSAAEACARVLRAARHPCVEQPLVGYADDGSRDGTGDGSSHGWRVKLYLQFRPGQTTEAALLVRRILGCRFDPAALGPELHLLGLDVGASGLRGAKLYYQHPAMPVATLSRLLGTDTPALPCALLDRPLLIHRMSAPDDDSASQPSELDFSLADSGLSWPQVRRSPRLVEMPAALASFAELERAFSLRVRRVSLSLPPRRKLTIYFGLSTTELDLSANLEGRAVE